MKNLLFTKKDFDKFLNIFSMKLREFFQEDIKNFEILKIVIDIITNAIGNVFRQISLTAPVEVGCYFLNVFKQVATATFKETIEKLFQDKNSYPHIKEIDHRTVNYYIKQIFLLKIIIRSIDNKYYLYEFKNPQELKELFQVFEPDYILREIPPFYFYQENKPFLKENSTYTDYPEYAFFFWITNTFPHK